MISGVELLRKSLGRRCGGYVGYQVLVEWRVVERMEVKSGR